MFTSALAPAAGTNLVVFIGFSIILQVLPSACTSSSQTSQKQADEVQSEESGEEGEEEMFEKKISLPLNRSKLPLPKVKTAESTLQLLLANPHPPLVELKSCSDELSALSDQSPNSESMLQTQAIMVGGIRKNGTLYHWCFFQMMQQLDSDLQNDNIGLLLEKRSENFLKLIKALWILARALDQALESDRYFEYLRSRYMELSESFFARTLDVVGPPLGNDRPKPKLEKSKPAGEIPDEDLFKESEVGTDLEALKSKNAEEW